MNISTLLNNFYTSHYSSNIMKLVLIGNQPVDELGAMAIKYFSDVDDRDLTKTNFAQMGDSPFITEGVPQGGKII